MAEWRPEGWENPHHAKVKAGKGNGKDMAFSLAYEAGADAMLAALRGKRHEETRFTGDPRVDGKWVFVEMRAEDIKGWSVVFIPDALVKVT